MGNGKIDWNIIHHRLEEINSTINESFSPTQEDMNNILKMRASKLSREPVKVKEGGQIEIVEFLLSNEHYCIESQFIQEVFPLKEYTPLPCVPSFVFGLINVRGQIIPVINIKKFYDIPDINISDFANIIILHNENATFSILADSIIGVKTIDVVEIEPLPATFTGIRKEFIKGVTGMPLMILDAKKLLDDRSIIVHEEA
jgi:purine-binding chemotaxis protein CheW